MATQHLLPSKPPRAKKSRPKHKRREDAATHSASPMPSPMPPSSPLGALKVRGQAAERTADSKEATFGADEFIGFEPDHHSDDEPASPNPYTDRSRRGVKRSIEDMLDGDDLDYSEHRRSSSSVTPWARLVEWELCSNPAEMLHYEVLAFMDHISASHREHQVRGMIIDLITQSVMQRWPSAVVSPFGSFETGLYLPMGDLDLVITLPKIDMDIVSALQKVSSLLQRDRIAKGIQVIANAKVPIIKFTSVHGNFLVDISINQTNGITAGQIINKFVTYHPALKPLVLVVKAFLSQRAMNEVFSGGLGSYSIVCMALSFLQMHPKIRNGEIDPMQNLGVIVVEFFEFYGHVFNYDDVGISLRDGGNYYNKAERGWKNGRQSYLLSVEDPQDEYNDVAKGSFGILRVRKTLAGAYEVLSATLLQRAEQISSQSRDRNSARRRSTRYRSILGTIITTTEDVLEHRDNVYKLWKSGILHRLTGRSPPPPSKSHSQSKKSSHKESRPQSPHSPQRSHSHDHHHDSYAHSSSVSEKRKHDPVEHYHNMERSPSRDGRAEKVEVSTEVDRSPPPNLRNEVDEDESRYTISEKNRAKHRAKALDVEFVSDEDGSNGVAMVVLDGSESSSEDMEDEAGATFEEEDFVLDVVGEEKADVPEPIPDRSRSTSRAASAAERRAYWVSKGGTN